MVNKQHSEMYMDYLVHNYRLATYYNNMPVYFTLKHAPKSMIMDDIFQTYISHIQSNISSSPSLSLSL